MRKGLLSKIVEEKEEKVVEVKVENKEILVNIEDLEKEVEGIFTKNVVDENYVQPRHSREDLMEIVSMRFGDVGYNMNEMDYSSLENIALMDEGMQNI